VLEYSPTSELAVKKAGGSWEKVDANGSTSGREREREMCSSG
jgi:hypothetical protein